MSKKPEGEVAEGMIMTADQSIDVQRFIDARGLSRVQVLLLVLCFHVVAADLRGYGDSVGPDDAGPNNINYSFRAMANDQVEVMERLGYKEFFVAGHDRGEIGRAHV